MKLKSFRIRMYKCIMDSDMIDVVDLTALVGKNESGKTSLLKALHKFNPFEPEPYSIRNEWPRGERGSRSEDFPVCSVIFSLNDEEKAVLADITDKKMILTEVEVTKDYSGSFEVCFPAEIFPDKLHPNDIDTICSQMASPSSECGKPFLDEAAKCIEESNRLAKEGRFSDLADIAATHIKNLNAVLSQDNPAQQHESTFVSSYGATLKQIAQALTLAPSIQKKAHDFVISNLPTFIYMSDYQTFQGTAHLDQLLQRAQKNKLTPDDRTVCTILKLSGLDLGELVRQGNSPEEIDERQFDISDGAATLTKTIENRWRQRKYEVEFRADGQFFSTYVKDEKDAALIKLEERSKGFQWFFSFDLLFMHETDGTFRNCVILLDEPGMHLHPEAQQDLLLRLEEYAIGNTLLYSTHLPFMINLREPNRIRMLEERKSGNVVTSELTHAQPEAKLVLQSALGMNASMSFLVAQKNLVVEGVDDYWIISELSNLLTRSGLQYIDEEVFITPSGGASEAVYLTTLMVGQNLQVLTVLDSDKAGMDAKDKLLKNWLLHYKKNNAQCVLLAEIVGEGTKEMSIEDIIGHDFYLKVVQDTYVKELSLADITKVTLDGNGQLVKQVERFFKAKGIKFNKGSVAKRLRTALSKTAKITDLPNELQQNAEALISGINSKL